MIKFGDRVRVSAHGAEAIEATVVLASQNGASLMLAFPGGLFQLADAGAYVGHMPVMRREDGRWVELINQREIQVEPVADVSPEETFARALTLARRLHAEGATHECSEWNASGVCRVCGRAAF